jgi:hypothetical protein
MLGRKQWQQSQSSVQTAKSCEFVNADQAQDEGEVEVEERSRKNCAADYYHAAWRVSENKRRHLATPRRRDNKTTHFTAKNNISKAVSPRHDMAHLFLTYEPS